MGPNPYVPPADYKPRDLLLGLAGLGLFLALQAGFLRYYTGADTRPPSWDQSIHMEIALDYKEAIKEGRLADAWYLPPKPGMPPFPPAYHLLLTSSYASSDPARAALWVNWLYQVLFCVSIFGLAWRYRPDDTALAAVVVLAASPAIQDLLTTQLVDLPLAAVAAAAYWALLASEGFSRWLPSLAFGLLHALGMMHKWSFFSYMLPAYFAAFGALWEKRTATIMLVSAALSAALSAPWYVSHFALLPSRLVQASTDFAIPVWSPGAWAVYFKQGSDLVGPVVWLLGALALIFPQYRRRREEKWTLLAWFVTTYVFWTIVPNRQFRFLVPGLVPLCVALASTWRKPVVWAAAVLQLAVMANFFGGWIGPVRWDTPFYSFGFLDTRPPRKEDWKTEEILRRIDAERDPAAPITNVTLVANDDYFNAPTFHWTQMRLGLKSVRMRGVNRRLSELSEFVLVKDPKVGPASVISGLPEAAAEIVRPGGWFGKAYEEIARWPLPDANNAILYRRRRGMKRPYAGKTLAYQHYAAGKVVVTDLKAAFGPWDPALSAYKTMKLTAGALDVRGLALTRAELDLSGVGFVPLSAGREGDWDDVRLLKLGRVRVNSVRVEAEDLKAFLVKRVKDLAVDEVALDKTVRVKGSYKGWPVAAEAELRLLQDPPRLKVDLLSTRLAGVGIPLSMFRSIKELTIPLYPNPETPFAIELPGLTVANGRLTIP